MAKGNAVELVFGKRLGELSVEEKKLWRRAVRVASYYRDHERGKTRDRENKRWMKRDVIKKLGLKAQCYRCGYDRYIGALDFHHRDPTQKDLRMSNNSVGFDRLVEEAKKCDLICANCHREVHSEMPQKHGGRPRKTLHPLIAAYLDAVGVVR